MATIHNTEAGEVIVEFIYPPIPLRHLDYVAYREEDGEEGPKGWGATKDEAIQSLLEKLYDDTTSEAKL